MKKSKIITSLAISLILMSSGIIKAQFTFSVSPGIQINCAGFGIHSGNFTYYAGIQFINASYEEERAGTNYIYNGSNYVKTPYDDIYKTSGTLYVPSLGTKYFFKTSNKLKMYGNALLTIMIPTYKIEDSNDPTANDNLKDRIKKSLFYGGQLGFGTEYFFDDNFSVGGEFGIRLLHGVYQEEYTNQTYNPNTGNSEEVKTDYTYRFNVNPTYVKISFNFYFSGGSSTTKEQQ